MTAAEKFRTLVRDHIAPTLEAAGFKQRGKGRFVREREDCWHVLELDKGTWSTEDHVEFTVELGVALRDSQSGRPDHAHASGNATFGTAPHLTGSRSAG